MKTMNKSLACVALIMVIIVGGIIFTVFGSSTDDTMVESASNLVVVTSTDGFVQPMNNMTISIENVVSATCTDSGSYDKVTYDENNVEQLREYVVVPPIQHEYISSSAYATCTEDGYTTYTCAICGDTYTEHGESALGHNCFEGTCTRCGWKDPDYVKIYSSKEIVEKLQQSLVTETGGLLIYTGTDSVSVFAEEKYNCLSMRTLVSYNLWGHNVQSAVFNISKLSDSFPVLNFYTGGKTGSNGKMTVEIFLDKPIEKNTEADVSFTVECSDIPKQHSIKIANKQMMAIRVTNHSGTENTLVFYDLYGEKTNR